MQSLEVKTMIRAKGSHKLKELREEGIKGQYEIVEHFKKTKEERCVKAIYSLAYPQIIATINKFPLLDDHDKISIALYEIYKSMQDYDFDAPVRSAPISFAITYIHRACFRETQMRQTSKRQLMFDNEVCGSYELAISNGFDKGEITEHQVELIDYLDSLELTDNEYKYCMLIIGNCIETKTQAAQILNVSSAAITYMTGTLKEKLEPLFNGN